MNFLPVNFRAETGAQDSKSSARSPAAVPAGYMAGTRCVLRKGLLVKDTALPWTRGRPLCPSEGADAA